MLKGSQCLISLFVAIGCSLWSSSQDGALQQAGASTPWQLGPGFLVPSRSFCLGTNSVHPEENAGCLLRQNMDGAMCWTGKHEQIGDMIFKDFWLVVVLTCFFGHGSMGSWFYAMMGYQILLMVLEMFQHVCPLSDTGVAQTSGIDHSTVEASPRNGIRVWSSIHWFIHHL